jgi:hypothetical protein
LTISVVPPLWIATVALLRTISIILRPIFFRKIPRWHLLYIAAGFAVAIVMAICPATMAIGGQRCICHCCKLCRMH